MADFRIGVDKSVECTLQEAKQVVAGFCFGTTSLVLRQQPGICQRRLNFGPLATAEN